MNRKESRKNSINDFLNSYFNLFSVIFVLFLLIVAYLMILKPKMDMTIATIEDNISQKTKVYQAEKNKLENLRAIIDAYDKIDVIDVERIKNILPEEYDKEKLFGEIEELVTKNGFILNSISLTKDGENVDDASNVNSNPSLDSEKTNSPIVALPDNIGKIEMELSIGLIDYASLKRFLVVLENNIRIMDIESISFAGDKSVTLNIKTYYYKK